MSEEITEENFAVNKPRLFRSALFGFFFTIASIMTGIGALMALSGDISKADVSLNALKINLGLIIVLAIYLFFRLMRVFFNSIASRSAPHLHRRFILIFSLAALVPAILVGIFFKALTDRNLSDIFGPTISHTMETSAEVSNAYLGKEIEDIMQDVRDMAFDLNEAAPELPNRITYTAFLINQAKYRTFPSVYVVDGNGRVLAKAEGPGAPLFVIPDRELFEKAKDGTLMITSRNELDFLVALFKLANYQDAYLYTGRYLRSGLLPNLDRITEVNAALTNFQKSSKTLNNVFFLTYIEVALLIFLAAIWLAMVLANRIVSPLGDMVFAAEKVRSGDLQTRIKLDGVWDEIGDLANAFNRMTKQISTQHEALKTEHEVSEQRRQFSEAVLSGVSAGVIGLSSEGRISVINASAEDLLAISGKDVIGKPLATILPSFEQAFLRAREAVDNKSEDQVVIAANAQSGLSGEKTLDVRVSAYQGENTDTGWVITFDDITRLVAAQRHSAWREVARRIAHEIKNPLTPIQLSAERLEKKYKSEIKSDPDVFKNCTNTIIRQVANLGRMVDEFSAFARMPAPILENVNLMAIIDETLFAQRVAFPDIRYELDTQGIGDVEIICDQRLISQALTNIYKNAGEAIARRIDNSGDDTFDGLIITRIQQNKNTIIIDIIDNGPGWPLDDKDRLLEPYMTTRDAGTGLGLAIVKRIVEDHGGSLELVDMSINGEGESQQIGAHVRILLPIAAKSNGETHAV